VGGPSGADRPDEPTGAARELTERDGSASQRSSASRRAFGSWLALAEEAAERAEASGGEERHGERPEIGGWLRSGVGIGPVEGVQASPSPLPDRGRRRTGTEGGQGPKEDRPPVRSRPQTPDGATYVTGFAGCGRSKRTRSRGTDHRDDRRWGTTERIERAVRATGGNRRRDGERRGTHSARRHAAVGAQETRTGLLREEEVVEEKRQEPSAVADGSRRCGQP
jgi:hypothetical protein